MPLDSRWIDAIHTRMLVRYGTRWTQQYAGVDETLVKADWARELAGLSPDAIKHGLENLPSDFPPNVSQFKALCFQNRPAEPFKALPLPKADPARVAAVLSQLKAKWAERKPIQWAYDLQEREKAGSALSQTQRQAWRDTLAENADQAVGGWFTPIPPEVWPEGMREELGRKEST